MYGCFFQATDFLRIYPDLMKGFNECVTQCKKMNGNFQPSLCLSIKFWILLFFLIKFYCAEEVYVGSVKKSM